MVNVSADGTVTWPTMLTMPDHVDVLTSPWMFLVPARLTVRTVIEVLPPPSRTSSLIVYVPGPG